MLLQTTILVFLVTLAGSSSLLGEDASQWHGFERRDFELNGVACTVVRPHVAAAGRPWIWRARFFGHEPQTEVELLRRGFHVATTDVAGLFGNDVALARWDAFYDHATERLDLSARPALLGMSRGGLIVIRWAADHPDRVSCIYVDAPVCDISSWPGGKGAGKGSASDWRRCLDALALDEEHVGEWLGDPVDRLAPLAAAGVPILSICGAADHVVPFEENTRVLERRYRSLGGPIRVIAKTGVGHHPHSLEDPAPIVNFVTRHCGGSGDYFVLRDGLARFRDRLDTARSAKVAFLGGSITANPGWRDLVAEDLRRRHPTMEFEFINAGVPSFGSTPGAFRMHRDVFAEGARSVDLLFVEAAVNDSTNGRSALEMTRGMEGIVRRAQRQNPEIDVVMMHFVDPAKMREIDHGIVPTVIRRHEAVAERYGVASIDLATEVTERIAAGEFTWLEDFRNLHPSPFGQRLYAATIGRLFDAVWSSPRSTTSSSIARVRSDPLDPFSYDEGRMVDVDRAASESGFAIDAAWRPVDGAGTRPGYVGVPMLVATEPGASLSFPFHGRAVGLLVVAGPDAGRIEVRVDDGEPNIVELFTKWSGGLHLPWSHVLSAELPSGEHVLHLRVAEGHHPKSRGHAVRIASFLVNGE